MDVKKKVLYGVVILLTILLLADVALLVRSGTLRKEPEPSAEPAPIQLTPDPEQLAWEAAARAKAEVQAREEADVRRLTEQTAQYQAGKELLFARDFVGGIAALEALGDFRDSAALARYAASYEASEPVFEGTMISDVYLEKYCPHGKLYSLSRYGRMNGRWEYRGMFYIPDEVNAETTFVQYYSGGRPGEDYLWYYGLYGYFDEYYPNAILVFANEPGTGDMYGRNQIQWDVLRHLAWECGTIVHDLSTIASSSGCYTAMQLAYQYYVNYGIPIRRVCTLDTGNYWDLEYMALNAEQCAVVAEAGTRFYLFEEPAFVNDLQKPAMQTLLRSGIDVTAYICKDDNHSIISQNAYSMGLFSFCAGERMELPAFEYFPVPLYEGITDLGDVSWPDKPADDPRTVYRN